MQRDFLTVRIPPLPRQPPASSFLSQKTHCARHSLLLKYSSTTLVTMYPTRILRMQPSRPLYSPAPKENHSAHTISQRLRLLKKIPPELLPLGLVLGVAVGAAFYSMGNKLMTDKTLRLSRSRPEDRE